MPNNNSIQISSVDRVFHALADSTRRSVVERLSKGPASVGNLAQSFDMALPSFMQHLQVLETCLLVRSSKKGRVRTYRLVPEKLQIVESWLNKQRNLWEQRLNQMDSFLLQLTEKRKNETKNKS